MGGNSLDVTAGTTFLDHYPSCSSWGALKRALNKMLSGAQLGEGCDPLLRQLQAAKACAWLGGTYWRLNSFF